MASYVVKFSNRLCGDNGHEIDVCQRQIFVPDAASPADAIATAKREFARLECVPDWSLRAREIEIHPG